jgi:antirestriction protein ArdC
VFNAQQVDGYTYTPPTSDRTEHERIAIGEALVSAAKSDGLTIREVSSAQAYYERSYDMVTLPELAQFRTPEDFYSTALHELAHASGHERRCNRESLATRFGDAHYAMEELIAEFAAAFMCKSTGISDSETARHGDYLASWVRVLQNDSKALASAASAAQKAADYWLQLAVTAEVGEEVAA